MLIRVDDNTFREFPDELAALILSNPCDEDGLQEFTASEVNVLIHGIFGTYYDSSQSYEKNIDRVKEIYLKLGRPTEEGYRLACEAVNSYNREITQNEIGLVDHEELFTATDSEATKKIT